MFINWSRNILYILIVPVRVAADGGLGVTIKNKNDTRFMYNDYVI